MGKKVFERKHENIYTYLSYAICLKLWYNRSVRQ